MKPALIIKTVVLTTDFKAPKCAKNAALCHLEADTNLQGQVRTQDLFASNSAKVENMTNVKLPLQSSSCAGAPRFLGSY